MVMARAAVRDSGRMIPAEVTEFIGRRRDLGEVRRMLSESRLVTLIGFGGVGKTRLALRLANQLGRSYPDGVCFVGLGDLSDSSLIAEATASALQLHDSAGRVSVPELAQFLRPRELLLVLDNCEHMIDDSAEFVAALLRACPPLHVLATSREALRVEGESVWRVGPLTVPASGIDGTAVVQEYEAVRLLTDRAMRTAPDFRVSQQNLPSIVEICRVLDGVPLALELAAVRLRALSADDLLEQLQGRWETLDVGTRGGPARHSAMSACLEWSHELCTQQEQFLWSLLSVFAGGMEMPAIRYVVTHADPDLADDVVELVQSLVDKSILTVETRDDATRYRMIEVIRQFGRAQLMRSGGLVDAQLWHRDWCDELLARCEEDWMSPRQISAVNRLRREEQNVREALTTCWRQPDQAGTGLQMAARLRKFAYIDGTFSEVRGWLHRFLSLVPDPDFGRLRGLRAAGWLALVQGDPDDGGRWLREARQLAEELGPPGTWLVRQAEGLQAMFLGDLPGSVSLHVEALTGLQGDEFRRQRAETLILLGMTYGFVGDLERAAATLEDCLHLCAAAEESYYRSYALWFSGLVAWQRGDASAALQLEREALKVSQPIGDRLLYALCFEALASCHAGESPKTAATLLGAAHTLWDFMGTSLTAMPGLSSFHETCAASLEQALGELAFTDLRGEGLALDTRSAVNYALGEVSQDSTGQKQGADGAPTATTLTKREGEIAELVARGMTNRDIATKLVISPRTAETHVENILIKLGFSNRSQIASWFSSRQG